MRLRALFSVNKGLVWESLVLQYFLLEYRLR